MHYPRHTEDSTGGGCEGAQQDPNSFKYRSEGCIRQSLIWRDLCAVGGSNRLAEDRNIGHARFQTYLRLVGARPYVQFAKMVRRCEVWGFKGVVREHQPQKEDVGTED